MCLKLRSVMWASYFKHQVEIPGTEKIKKGGKAHNIHC